MGGPSGQAGLQAVKDGFPGDLQPRAYFLLGTMADSTGFDVISSWELSIAVWSLWISSEHLLMDVNCSQQPPPMGSLGTALEDHRLPHLWVLLMDETMFLILQQGKGAVK